MQDFHTQKLGNELFKTTFSVELRNRFSALEVEENIYSDCVQMETFKQKLPKKGRNLESNSQTADDPWQNTQHEIREEKKQAKTGI